MSENSELQSGACWTPLPRRPRRVLAVLVEKAKTTPDNYPLTIASLVSGCNQKSNRDPQMQLDEDEVVEALDLLRSLGAAREVQGSGRVNKYRHAAYEWLGVNGPQSAVMTELLLRGPQTAGELRARTARMEPFADLAALTSTLIDLQAKGLVTPISSPGRAQTFAHCLYEPDESARLSITSSQNSISPTGATSAPAGFEKRDEGGSQPPHDGRDNRALLESTLEEIRELRQRVERLERELGLDAEGPTAR